MMAFFGDKCHVLLFPFPRLLLVLKELIPYNDRKVFITNALPGQKRIEAAFSSTDGDFSDVNSFKRLCII